MLLLKKLDPDWERAGQKYELLRKKLIFFFNYNNCPHPEDCADEVFDRIGKRIAESEVIKKDLKNYAFGVAKNVLKEFFRNPEIAMSSDIIEAIVNTKEKKRVNNNDDQDRQKKRCMDQCLNGLPEADRNLLERYMSGMGRDRLKARKRLKSELAITIESLRLKKYRIKKRLMECYNDCLQDLDEN